ncbi:hypothetical protein N6H18_14635 [Reichenbachiella agarivorans]|uniref:DUF4136 domain-containing protein n=1 Tax=Reichenbachiella agarivorans TaxID=2979464 RepID=A0ABY6CM52_9BACT|nr:hypothetical protein [Reichenbachiella agarivorans]UXP31586.1 hypothetical protein N6H18_14635 [Reichenbachiella agarivorans]
MRYCSVLLISLCFMACQSEIDQDTDRLGANYFPMEMGQYRIYDVHEINYYLIGPEESNYQLKEEVVDSTLLSHNKIEYKLHRSVRADDTQTWKLDSVWTTQVGSSTIVANENNVSYVKLVFPIENNLVWDANVYNTRGAEYYQYAAQKMDTTLFDTLYVDAVKVIQSDLGYYTVGRDDRYELFAADIGMILKYSIVWEYFQEDGTVDANKIVGGRDLVMTMIEYGKTE